MVLSIPTISRLMQQISRMVVRRRRPGGLLEARGSGWWGSRSVVNRNNLEGDLDGRNYAPVPAPTSPTLRSLEQLGRSVLEVASPDIVTPVRRRRGPIKTFAILGGLLLILAVFVGTLAASNVSVCTSGVGVFAQGVSAQAAQTCNANRVIEAIAICVGLIGIGFGIAAIVLGVRNGGQPAPVAQEPAAAPPGWYPWGNGMAYWDGASWLPPT
jgi:hypothetical protein